jgi:hypothetical protein
MRSRLPGGVGRSFAPIEAGKTEAANKEGGSDEDRTACRRPRAFTAAPYAQQVDPSAAQPTFVPTAFSERIDLYARAADSIAECRIAGQVTLWASRAVKLMDGTRKELGTIEAGLAQFGPRSTLGHCGSNGAVLDVSNRFVNFLVADYPISGSAEAPAAQPALVAARLAMGTYQIAEQDGSVIPLLDRAATGSVSDRLTIVLIRKETPGAFEAVVQRDAKLAAR